MDQPWVRKCYSNVSSNKEEAFNIAIKKVTADISFLAGSTNNGGIKEEYEYWIRAATDEVKGRLEKAKQNFSMK